MIRKSFRPDQLDELPRESGVYYFFNRAKEIIYVGKATSLRSRVNSYWQRPQNQTISRFLTEVHRVRIQPTVSALEALILEANEIKRLQPPYNVLQKDDKRFASIVITREPFPQLMVVRPTDKRKFPIARTFGPYLSAHNAKLALKILRRIFPFRCNRPVQAGKACMYYHLGLCPGTCVGVISRERYRETIERITQFLSGKRPAVARSLKQAMAAAAKHREFEEAARLRDQLFALEHIHDVALMTDDRENAIAQFPIQRIEAYDISLAAGRDAVGSMVVLRYGIPTPSEYRLFKIRTVEGTNDVAMLQEVIKRRLTHPEWSLPDLFAIDGGIPQRNAAATVLRDAGQRRPAVIGIAKGPERKRADIIPTPAARELLRHHGISDEELEKVFRVARDEAHRFAITYHRKLRSRRMFSAK